MFEATKTKILLLDPDQDFLNALRPALKTLEPYSILEFILFTKQERPQLEEIILSSIPDIVCVNLDLDDELAFGKEAREILHVPLPLPPIVIGTTIRGENHFQQKAYQAGVQDFLVRPFTPMNLALRLDVAHRTRKLQRQLGNATHKLYSMNTQLSEMNARLAEVTVTDELTGLRNMRFMNQYLEKHFQIIKRYKHPFTLIMMDLDHFKNVNDENDHLVGSAVIKQVGQLIGVTLRESDIKGRYGGDEFIMALPDTSIDGSRILGERLRKAVLGLDIKLGENKELQLTSSIGMATFDPERHHSFTDLLKDADAALYAAKEQGRNCVVHFSDLIL